MQVSLLCLLAWRTSIRAIYSSIDHDSDSFLSAASAPDTAMLGKSGLVVSALGIGTLQWGDPQCGFAKQYTEVMLLACKHAIHACSQVTWQLVEEEMHQHISPCSTGTAFSSL